MEMFGRRRLARDAMRRGYCTKAMTMVGPELVQCH